MPLRLTALVVVAAAIVALDGCSDSLGPKPSQPNIEGKVTLYALNGSALNRPSALLFWLGTSRVVDQTFNFDVAFDINAAGDVQVYTVRAVASQFVTAHRVGLQPTTLSFVEATRAPTSGYTYDSSLVVPVGQTVLVDVVQPTCPVYSLLGPNVRGKFVVDSINKANRSLFVHVLSTGQNCGVRSLVPGGEVPPD